MIRLAGLAALAGGALWVAKGAAILATGDQPEYLFEVAPAGFVLGLVGLQARVGATGGRPARAGGALAWAALAVAAAAGAYYASTGDDDGPALSMAIPLVALAIVGALVLLGIAARRTDALGEAWRSLPLWMGAATLPLLALGGALEAIDERLLEIPIVLLGLAWIGLGYRLARA